MADPVTVIDQTHVASLSANLSGRNAHVMALLHNACYRCTDPATWMLDISTVTAEERRREDLAGLFAQSRLRQCVLAP